MQTEVKLGTVLDDGLVEGGEKHVVLVVQLGHRDYHQTVILTDVAPNQSSVTISAGPIGDEQFLEEGVLQVGHLRLVKF